MKRILIYFVVFISLTSCASFDMYPFQRHRFADHEKLFYEIDNRFVMEERREETIFMNDKVFLQGIISTVPATFNRLPFQHYTLKDFDANLKKALENKIPNFEMQEEVLWTDKIFPEVYAFQNYDPKEVKHEDLLKLANIRDNELVLIPLVSVYVNERSERDYVFYKLNVALYVIDSYQIYHGKSVGLSKSFNVKKVIEEHQFRFSASDWEFLIIETLGDLVEREETKGIW